MRELATKAVAIAIASALLVGCGGSRAQAASSLMNVVAMAKLHFMAGRWTCAIHGPKGFLGSEHLTYRFTANGAWMEETGDMQQGGEDYSSVQMWGFNIPSNSLVAYQFSERGGVQTKTVDGWQNGDFVSHRNDNGATVSIHPKSTHAFDWIITSKDQSTTVREECTR